MIEKGKQEEQKGKSNANRLYADRSLLQALFTFLRLSTVKSVPNNLEVNTPHTTHTTHIHIRTQVM